MNPLTACQKEYQKLLRRWRQPSNRYIPRCSADGSYAQVQCAGGVCFCVSSQGKEIPGTKTVNSARQPNCTHPGNLHYLNYIYIYIWDPIYRSTNMVLILKSCLALLWRSRIFSISHSASYICLSKFINDIIPEWIFIFSYSCLFSDANITPCEKKRRDSIFYSKKFIPFCKPDGSWSEIQCGKSSRDCWCVDSDGNELPGTRGSNLEICPDFGLYSFSLCIPLIELQKLSVLLWVHWSILLPSFGHWAVCTP